MKLCSRLVLILSGAALAVPSIAEEASSGHYSPGASASFIDVLPYEPCFAYVNQFVYYGGDVSGSTKIPIGRNIVSDVKATSYADIHALVYQSAYEILGGRYAAVAAIPFARLDIDVSGAITGPRGRTLKGGVSDRAEGLGDIYAAPFILVWKKGDITYDTRLGVYAPTGEYDKYQLANLGKNYWTLEPSVSMCYLGSKNGIEVSTFAGVDFNTENQDTDYQTGEQAHADMTVAQHLPLGKGFAGVGANGFYYQQINGDSGPGAKLGGFEGQTAGVGPVVSYITKIGDHNLLFELKWLRELETENRLEGDYVWVKAAVSF
ncbi:MAG: transporter [bacterium]